ncbi:LOW QUALITY PROTEIN: anthranilate synthase beta subunit 1, chloroplastic-like [Diospyros lotus]|uniref:LOW QUALITY PROTEIN: anthranilate synthase beta subunit 1, chloroplastic-like n=1 Tax=Diospyros lotus TaxID=55363 RepID=UPI00225A387D|nr:LOW QUALITY PROTEIN: anthranilate synthase beta subunit 1, chloroplastic-like [Diospyros lotus]
MNAGSVSQSALLQRKLSPPGIKTLANLSVNHVLSRVYFPSHKPSCSHVSCLLSAGVRRMPLAVSDNTAASSAAVTEEKVTSPIVVIDNYDSFTYNLCQYMGELGCNFEVYRNDELTVDELKKKNPRGVLISPGPGAPQDSGISLQTVLELGPTTPLFGVCMGLQCIGEAFGGKIIRAPYGVVHGKSSLVYYNEGEEDGLFAGLPK